MICEEEGCEKSLRSDNKSGRCKVHYHRSTEQIVKRKDWYNQNKEEINSWRRNYNQENGYIPNLKSILKRKHGMTIEQWQEMVEAQDNKCAVCHEEPLTKRLAIDHDHSCCPKNYSCIKCRRGLLCEKCNRGLGIFKDDPKLLRMAADYLERK